MTDKMKMQTRDGVADNISWIAEKFPNCVTEKIDATTGEVKLAVDFDMLRQELSSEVVDGKDERYQFVWPDKKKAILLANAPINATLRPCEKEGPFRCDGSKTCLPSLRPGQCPGQSG